jgi:UDP-glucose 4-epimerase
VSLEVFQTMNLLVAGGAGYIGTALTDSLTRAGHAVRVLDRHPSTLAGLPADCEYVCSDLLDAEGLRTALDYIEAVYHLAWSFHPGDYRREVEENLLGTLNLLDACKVASVRHVIFASSAAVYSSTGEEPARESDPCHPERTTIGGPVYAITKLACEHYWLASQRDGPAVTVLRIHGVFSKDRLAQFSTMIEQATASRDIVAVAEAGGQYAHLDDVVWALAAVLGKEQAFGEVFNVAGSRAYRDPDIAHYIASKAGTRRQVVLINDPGQSMISVSTDKLTRTIGYHPRESDFLRDFIDARFP